MNKPKKSTKKKQNGKPVEFIDTFLKIILLAAINDPIFLSPFIIFVTD